MFSLLQNDSDAANTDHLAEYCTIVSLLQGQSYSPNSFKSLLGYFSEKPRSYVDTFDSTVKVAIEEVMHKVDPDVVIVSTLEMAQYVIGSFSVPSILIDHNCEFAVLKRSQKHETNRFKRFQRKAGWMKTARWESKICHTYDAVVMPTEGDRRQMMEFAPHLNNIHVIPNGVDTDYFDPMKWSPTKDRLVYNGSMTYDANLDAVHYFASEIYPLLKQKHPNIKLVVTGRTDGVDLEKIKECSGIELTGFVEDIRKVLYSSYACVIPLRLGGGMRLKIPEAMAAGVPVVSTSMGAEGLNSENNKHLLIADTPNDFSMAVERILVDENLALHLKKNARVLMEKSYSWKILGKEFLKLVENVAAKMVLSI